MDTAQSSPNPTDVTIAVTQRERFEVAVESLRSIVAETQRPYELDYVDANGPRDIETDLQPICTANGFRYLQFDRAHLQAVIHPSTEAWTRGLSTGRSSAFRVDDAPADALHAGLKGSRARRKTRKVA